MPECPRSSGWSAARSDDAAAAADGDVQAPLAVGDALVSVGGRDTCVGCVLAEEATVETEAESPGPKFIHQHQNQCVGLVVYRYLWLLVAAATPPGELAFVRLIARHARRRAAA